MLEQLRQKHRALRFISWQANTLDGVLRIEYRFLLEPDIEFNPSISLPVSKTVDPEIIERLALRLGMVELISYWKAACPQRVIIEPLGMHGLELSWWHDLFIHGLGEFFYRNQIDFSGSDFLIIELAQESSSVPTPLELANNGNPLILVGGGKDSVVTLELLKNNSLLDQAHNAAMILNPFVSAERTTAIAGYHHVLRCQRKIDPQLLALNQSGYFNGHTPFSAYLAFLGSLVAATNGYSLVIASNEASANEANTELHGIGVNHQYSKSYRFESAFRSYISEYHLSGVEYFSFLRPLHEIQIAQLFAQMPRYWNVFRSCNVGQKENSWCGHCPKCAFTYLCLFPFIAIDRLDQIFGARIFANSQIQTHIADLVGLGQLKPFECVGTDEESRFALQLSLRKARECGEEIPAELQAIADKLPTISNPKDLFSDWNSENFLPPVYQELLKQRLALAGESIARI